MYWYLSFLRPPPVALALPAEGVVITPQVANDLRTELRDAPTEISYTWQRVLPSPAHPTKPQHLTTFAPPASTYRPLTVPLPRAARPGESWRLGLVCPPAAGPSSIPLLDLSEGDPGVLGVWSEGIDLKRGQAVPDGPVRGVGAVSKGQGKDKPTHKSKDKGKGKDDGPKQGRISRDWPLPGDNGQLKLVEQTSFDLDKKVWDSGLALSSWLWKYIPNDDKALPAAARDVLKLLRRPGMCMVELGSGTGLVSMALAQVLSSGFPSEDGSKLTATDLESAMEIMRENIALNGVEVTPDVLDWDAPLPSWVREHWPDVVIAADVTYNTSSFPALVATLERLLLPPSGEAPPLLLAYKQRDAAERDLWEMLKAKGLETELVDKIAGAEEEGQVEIWVVRRK